MHIKKLFVLSALTLFTAQAGAQTPAEEGACEFVPHWYLQLQAGANETLGEAKFFDLVSPSVQAAIGYQFNPYIGVRVKANGWQAKGGWVNPEQTYKFNQVGLQADVRLDLTNLIGGYKPCRKVSVGIFAGGGGNMAWGNDEAQALSTHNYNLPYLWDGTKIRAVGNAGLDVNVNVSKRVSLGLEANAHILNDHFNSKKAGNADWMFNALLGVKVALGKTCKRKAVPVIPVVEARPVAPARPEVVEEKKPEVVEVKDLKVDIFFDIRSSQVKESEMGKMEELIAYMKTYTDKKVNIKGYADKGTGNAKINMTYSEQRIACIKALLVNAGIDESRISTEALGDTEQPYADNDRNRVCICISK